MNSERIHRDRDEMIEKYLRNELSDQETDIFEAHLLSCVECRNEVIKRSSIFDSLEKYAARKTFQSGKERDERSKKLARAIWLVAAAGVALMIGLFLLPNREDPSDPTQNASTENLETEEDTTGLTDTRREDIYTLPKERIANLESFQVHPVYENQIGTHVRAGNLRGVSPVDSIECIPGASIEIRFPGAETDSLFLVLLNNLGEILLEEKITSPYSFPMHFPEGLYYWQLTNEEEALHTAKIIIR